MDFITIKTINELREFISNIEKYSKYDTNLHITGDLYADLTRTFVALGKCNVQKGAGIIAALGAAAALVTGGLSLIVSGIAFAGGSTAAVLAVKEFQASPYADEVYVLAQHGFKVIRNNNPIIVLG